MTKTITETNTKTTTNENTALQVTNFDFYGDELIALKDNAIGEIYTSITQVLRAIGFTDKQIEYQRKKFIKDSVISKSTLKFSGVDLGMTSVDEVWCISNRKLPIALTKILVTPKMKQSQPELASKLELYQDKCADVLAAVFIDNKSIDSIKLQLLTEKLKTIEKNQEKILFQLNQSLEEKSAWLKNTLSKLGLLQSFLEFLDTKNTLPDNLKPNMEKSPFHGLYI